MINILRGTAIWGLGTVMASAAPFSEMDCFIEPNEVVAVASADQGIVRTLDVAKGDRVSAGQRLFALDSSLEAATLELARARAKMADEIRAREASSAYSQRKLERVGQLYSRQAIPLHQKDEVETEAVLAKLQVRQARDNRQLAVLEERRAKTLLERRTVLSPLDGVIIKQFKSPGEYVEGEPVVQIAQLDPLKVEVIVPVTLFGQVRPGMTARVYPEIQEAGRAYQATVSVVDPVADVASGTFGVSLELPNPDHRLPSGLKCSLQFQTAGDEVTNAQVTQYRQATSPIFK